MAWARLRSSRASHFAAAGPRPNNIRLGKGCAAPLYKYNKACGPQALANLSHFGKTPIHHSAEGRAARGTPGNFSGLATFHLVVSCLAHCRESNLFHICERVGGLKLNFWNHFFRRSYRPISIIPHSLQAPKSAKIGCGE